MRILPLLMGCVLLAMPGVAQEYPKGELYGGYAFARSDTFNELALPVRNVPAGFAVNFAGNFTNYLGAVGDFGFHFKEVTEPTIGTSFSAKIYTYLGGVRIAGRGERATGFAHVMAGAMTAVVGGVGSKKGFAFGFGGGADVNATDRIAVRGEFLWIPADLAGGWHTLNYRFGGVSSSSSAPIGPRFEPRQQSEFVCAQSVPKNLPSLTKATLLTHQCWRSFLCFE